MEKPFLAKSDGETIIQHTKNLLENLYKIKNMYPEIPVNWDLLELACKYHDLGKMNHLFQEKISRGIWQINGEIPHALMSIPLIPVKKLKKKYSLEEIRGLVYAVALHHERDFSAITKEDYKKEVAELKENVIRFPFSELELEPPSEFKPLSERFYLLNHRLSSDKPEFYSYVLLKGLLNKIDYAASGHYEIEYPPNFLEKNLSKVIERFRENDPAADWNAMQRYVLAHQDESLLVIGQTGLGKTEAGLIWIGDHKGFFTLPLKTAINAIYERIRKDIADPLMYQKQIGILHSDSFAVLLSEFGENEAVEELVTTAAYLDETRSWSLPLTVTTLDQTFDFVYHYAGFEAKLATFTYAKIVIDEVQMYSPDLLAYLIKGLKEIQSYGGKFLVMTATMPEYLIDLFKEHGLVFQQSPAPFLDEKLLERHHLKVESDILTSDAIIERYNGKKLLVICNTIKKAKEIYQGLKKHVDVPVYLFHSQFIRQDRQTKEKDIFDFAQSNQQGIWVATQVVEASLDIDFDLLITELSELNGLFQRMGRCYRKRRLIDENNPNVYVFDGGSATTSGISVNERAVVHQDIFELAKQALQSYQTGSIIGEAEKMELIATTYSTENMKKTVYYQRIKDMLSWLSAIENDNKSKAEVQNLFRNINSQNVIPKEFYEKNQYIIDTLLDKLKEEHNGLSSNERKMIYLMKQKARTQLENYMLSIPQYLFEKCRKQGEILSKKIGRFDTVYFIGGRYDSADGYEPPQKIREDVIEEMNFI